MAEIHAMILETLECQRSLFTDQLPALRQSLDDGRPDPEAFHLAAARTGRLEALAFALHCLRRMDPQLGETDELAPFIADIVSELKATTPQP